MSMHNPPHPGKFIKETYLKLFDLSVRYVAKKLDVSPSTFNRLVKGQSVISPEMALRISAVLGRSPESWLAMQDQYNIWQAKKKAKISKLKRIDFDMLSRAA